MQNEILGKTVKAMYKLSGKTLTQISEETGLSIDTINNLFYARLQKPGFNGVCALVKAMGYTMNDLFGFLEVANDLPVDTDFVKEFTEYMFSVKETASSVESTKKCIEVGENVQSGRGCCTKMNDVREEYEHQIAKYRETNSNYVEQITEQYQNQIVEMKIMVQDMSKNYKQTISELRTEHEKEIGHLEKLLKQSRNLCMGLNVTLVAVVIACAVSLLLLQ